MSRLFVAWFVFAVFVHSGVTVRAAEGRSVAGTVVDSAGAPVAQARVELLDSKRVELQFGTTDEAGHFEIQGVTSGRYIVRVAAPLHEPSERVVVVEGASPAVLEFKLSGSTYEERVVVTATPGIAQNPEMLSQPVNVIDEQEIAQRAHTVTAQIAAEEPGLHLQRTSPTIGAIFIRGFTGNKVNVFVDGVRYSTGAMRGGINTFLNLIDPGFLSGVEVLRGSNSAQYGSDAIGGSLQFLTRSPSLSPDGPRFEGEWGFQAAGADESLGGMVSASYATPRFGIVATLAGRSVNDLRAGDGIDSHNAVTRYLGLPSSAVIDDRLPDTSFDQGGGALKLEWALTPKSHLVGGIFRSEQDDGKRYDQLIGGDGNLIADLDGMVGQLAYVRYEQELEGWFHDFSVGYSYNIQREERVNQGGSGNPTASINHEPERTTAHGVQAQLTRVAGRHSASLGADAEFEEVTGASFGVNPTTGVASPRRGRVPDGATYDQGGVYLQDVFEVKPGKLALNGAVRWSGARYHAHASDSPVVGGAPLWPDDSLDVSSFTFRAGAVFTATRGVYVSGNVSSGYRAPHITDLGTLGLTGSGFEVAAPDVAGLGGTIGSTADAAAVSTGRPVEQVDPETSLTYEAGLHVQRGRFDTHLTAFVNNVDDNITKQTLILPPGAVGTVIGDQTITSQNANGAVFVDASPNPVLVRSNLGDAQVVGFEYALSATLTPRWYFSTVGTILRAEDRDTGLPPNIEGGTPPPEAYVTLRWLSASRHLWVEPYLHAAAKQDRLSSLDLTDRRTGAGRSASSIASFFNNGARARGLIGPGADTTPNTSDDVLLATGETLAEVQLRVLGPGLAPSSLYTEIPSYTTVGVRSGLRVGPHEILLDFENLTDENYRGPSWGMDAPGRGVYLSYRGRWGGY